MVDETRTRTIILQPGETLRCSGGASCECLAGRLWLTDRGRDVILYPGQSYCSNDEHHAIVVVNPVQRPVTFRVVPVSQDGCAM